MKPIAKYDSIRALAQAPLTKVDEDTFHILVWMFVEGHEIDTIAHRLKLSTRTVGGYLRTLREGIARNPGASTELIRGRAQIGSFTHKAPGTIRVARRPTLLGLMNQEGEVRIFPILNRSKSEIYPLIKLHVQRGAELIVNNSNLFNGLIKDGYPTVHQYEVKGSNFGVGRSEGGLGLSEFWVELCFHLRSVRAVRSNTFLPQVREFELRWNYRNRPTVEFYRHVLATRWWPSAT